MTNARQADPFACEHSAHECHWAYRRGHGDGLIFGSIAGMIAGTFAGALIVMLFWVLS